MLVALKAPGCHRWPTWRSMSAGSGADSRLASWVWKAAQDPHGALSKDRRVCQFQTGSAGIFQSNTYTETRTEVYYEGFSLLVLKAAKSHNLPPVAWRPRWGWNSAQTLRPEKQDTTTFESRLPRTRSVSVPCKRWISQPSRGRILLSATHVFSVGPQQTGDTTCTVMADLLHSVCGSACSSFLGMSSLAHPEITLTKIWVSLSPIQPTHKN